jgi:hypothetical protein
MYRRLIKVPSIAVVREARAFDAQKITPVIGDPKHMTVKPVSPYLWRRVNRRIDEPPTCLFAGLEHSYQENL